MGNNDSLPPPPPPGQPPQPPAGAVPPPPPPPAVPQFGTTGQVPVQPAAPDVAPTTQMPTMSTPAAPPPGGPPTAPMATPPSGNSKLPWIITGVVAVVAAVVVLVVALGRDDETTVSPGTSAAPTSEPATTLVPESSTSLAPETTLQITVPETSAPATTSPTEPGVVVVADDTGVFTVIMLDTFEIDPAPVESDGVQFAHVSGADNLADYNREDDHSTFGITVLVGNEGDLAPADELLQLLDPGVDVCTDRTTESGYPTLSGNAEMLLLDGCDVDGLSSKVIMTLPQPDRGKTIIVIAQGPGPSNTDLLDFTQAVLESIVLL